MGAHGWDVLRGQRNRGGGAGHRQAQEPWSRTQTPITSPRRSTPRTRSATWPRSSTTCGARRLRAGALYPAPVQPRRSSQPDVERRRPARSCRASQDLARFPPVRSCDGAEGWQQSRRATMPGEDVWSRVAGARCPARLGPDAFRRPLRDGPLPGGVALGSLQRPARPSNGSDESSPKVIRSTSWTGPSCSGFTKTCCICRKALILPQPPVPASGPVRWYVVGADSPVDAFSHMRQALAGGGFGCARQGRRAGSAQSR